MYIYFSCEINVGELKHSGRKKDIDKKKEHREMWRVCMFALLFSWEDDIESYHKLEIHRTSIDQASKVEKLSLVL